MVTGGKISNSDDLGFDENDNCAFKYKWNEHEIVISFNHDWASSIDIEIFYQR